LTENEELIEEQKVRKKPGPRYLYSPPKKPFDKRMWKKLWKKYILSKKDLDSIWDIIPLKMFEILLKENRLVIPQIGTIEIKILRRKKETSLSNAVPIWHYPISKIVFLPSPELRKVFHNKYFPLHEIRKLESGNFDWIEKSNSKIKYERKWV